VLGIRRCEQIRIARLDGVLQRAREPLESRLQLRAQPDLRQIGLADAVDLIGDALLVHGARHRDDEQRCDRDRDEDEQLEAKSYAHGYSIDTALTPLSVAPADT
jgi:hypothetical protein